MASLNVGIAAFATVCYHFSTQIDGSGRRSSNDNKRSNDVRNNRGSSNNIGSRNHNGNSNSNGWNVVDSNDDNKPMIIT